MIAYRPSSDDPAPHGADRRRRGRHGPRGVRVALAAILALAAVAVAVPAASAAPWQCDSFGYLFQTPSAATHDVIQLDLVTGEDTSVASTPENTNAVGYNVLDDFVYGMENVDVGGGVTSNSLVRIHDDGSVDDLGLPVGMMDDTNYFVGDVDGNGHLWVLHGLGGGMQRWYQVDVTGPSPVLLDQDDIALAPTMSNIPFDWAWVNGAFYGVAAASPSTGPARLVSFAPGDTTWTDHGPLAGLDSGSYGAVFVDSAGYLYASHNTSGNIYRIDPATGDAILVTDDGPPSSNNDGARCAAAPIPTITVAKAVAGRVRPADQFTVGLVRPDGSAATSVTTSGSETTASTVDFPASEGDTYTITDAMGPGSPTPLGEYVQSISCLDGDGDPVATGGGAPSWTLTVAAAESYTCTVTNGAEADLELSKSASPSPVVPGEDVTYSLAVTNHGPSTATNVQVSDELPDELSFVSASSECGESGGTLTCTLGALAPGASHTFTVTLAAPSGLEQCPRNSATVTSAIADPQLGNNSAEICPPLGGRIDLSIHKIASRDEVPAGGQAMYTLVVRNHGPSDDTGVRVVDPMAAGLTLVAAKPSQGSCSTADDTLTCDLGTLRNGGSAQILVTADVWDTPGDIANTSTVSGSKQETNLDNNQDPATIAVVPGPEPESEPSFDLRVAKVASDRRVVIGQRVRYRIVVRNNGPDAAPDVELTDTLSAPVRVLRVRASQGECSRRIPMRCELGEIGAGERVRIAIVARHWQPGCRQINAASATGAGTDANPANNLDRVGVCVRKVRLRLAKVASRRAVAAGQVLGYRIRVRNPTPGVARRVRVCDRLPRGLVYVASKPRGKLRNGRRCWTIERLGPRKTKTVRMRVRALAGASGRKVNRAVANSPDVGRRARARGAIRVLGQQIAAGGVTG